MRKILAAALLLSACAPEPERAFDLGLIGPVGPGVEAAARAEGLVVAAAAPERAELHHAGVPVPASADERLADWSRLRLLVSLAAVRGREGVFFTLPKAAPGGELTSYPEEWQALARVAREYAALRPILESGLETPAPFPTPEGLAVRAWRYRGRPYLLLVNEGARPAPLAVDDLKPWRALFEARADARELLVPCGSGRCLPGERALWLEGRL